MDQIKEIYTLSVASYEKLLDLKSKTNKTATLDELYADVVTYLSEKNYASAEATLTKLNQEINKQQGISAGTSSPGGTSITSITSPPPTCPDVASSPAFSKRIFFCCI